MPPEAQPAEPAALPRYRPDRTYQWNYDHAPDPVPVEVPEVPGSWEFLGHRVGSPLGVAAGPLLNGRWLLYYAHLGFDVLVYKTVRSVARPCYEPPNLVPVECSQLSGDEDAVNEAPRMQGSWAVSFGMPSQAPDVWRRDVAWTRRQLPLGKVLCVSVVGTEQPGGGIDALARDYAQVARWAVEAGAQVIEANFSCPNVDTTDGQLYRSPELAARVARDIRQAIGPQVPLVLKIGHVEQPTLARELVQVLSGTVQALAMTNSVAARVRRADGSWHFQGQRRGICGRATFPASLEQLRLFARVVKEHRCPLRLIGVGGVESAHQVRQYLDAGAHGVHLATAAMVDPAVGVRIRAELAAAETSK